jgi:histidine ammonia-lyase
MFISLFSSVLSIHRDLQSRLIVSHCAGVGEPLTIERARMMFALRINILAKGYSGISEDTLHKIIAAFNSKKYMYIDIRIFVYLESCIPEIPSQGTVGASGDLAPLAHLAAGICVARKKIVFKKKVLY